MTPQKIKLKSRKRDIGILQPSSKSHLTQNLFENRDLDDWPDEFYDPQEVEILTSSQAHLEIGA